MKVKVLGLVLVLICSIGLVACSNDYEQQDRTETVMLSVLSETSTYQPWGSPQPLECMLVKEGPDPRYRKIGMSSISGFEYEKGYEYTLSVDKTIVATPADDGSNIRYKWKATISRTLVKQQ